MHHEHTNEEMGKKCLLIYVFIQHTNNKTGIGQTTGFVDELSGASEVFWHTDAI